MGKSNEICSGQKTLERKITYQACDFVGEKVGGWVRFIQKLC